jgi:hypothetical protein
MCKKEKRENKTVDKKEKRQRMGTLIFKQRNDDEYKIRTGMG